MIISLFVNTFCEYNFPYMCKGKRTGNCPDETIWVCGWNFKFLSCSKPPCNKSFRHPCLACKDYYVEKVTEGTCPGEIFQ